MMVEEESSMPGVLGEEGLRPQRSNKKLKLMLMGLAALLVGGGAVGAAMYFTSAGKAKDEGKAYNQVTTNLVEANTLMVNASRVEGDLGPSIKLPNDAVVVPGWKAAEEAKPASPSSYPTAGGAGTSGATTTTTPKKSDDKDWKQASPGTAAVCYPKNGYEIVKMVNGSESPCRVIVLTKPFTYGYIIHRQMNVTMPKVRRIHPPPVRSLRVVGVFPAPRLLVYVCVQGFLIRPPTYPHSHPQIIVGNPLSMPMINCTKKIERCFESTYPPPPNPNPPTSTHPPTHLPPYLCHTVMPGGRLDTRFIQIVRGGGRYLNDQRSMRVNMGTHVRVQVGGEFTATGCIFRERNNTLRSFMEEAENTIEMGGNYFNFNLGQYLTVIGGNLFLQGCVLLRIRPYGTGYLTTFSMGREVLVMAGNAVFTGVADISHYFFASYPWVSGKVLCVMGGTATMVGGGSWYTAGAQIQVGYGIDLAVLGGVLVTVGWSYGAAAGAILRISGGQFSVGGGTYYQTGFSYARMYVVFACFGAGVTYAIGGGNFQFIGGSYFSAINNGLFAGVGGNTFMGAGSLTWIGVPQTRYYLTNNIYGLGAIYYNGAGSTTFIALPQYSSYLAYYMAGIGTDTFIGAGWLTSIQNTRVSYALVYAFQGLGTQMYIGAGGAIFIKTFSYYKRLKYYTTWPYTYTVGGFGGGIGKFGFKQKNLKNQTIVLSKDSYLSIQYNKATGVWKKKRTFAKPANKTLAGSARSLAAEPKPRAMYHHYQRSLREAERWLQASVVNALESMMEKGSSIVLVDSTLKESTGKTPPNRDLYFGRDILTSADPYAVATSIIDDEGTDIDSQGKVSVGEDTSCFMCDVGPGETADHDDGGGVCEIAEGCKGKAPLDSWGMAQDKSSQDLTFPQMDFIEAMTGKNITGPKAGKQELPDLYFLWYELTVFCYSRDPETDDSTITANCLSEAYVHDIIQAFVDDDLESNYELAISTVGLHASTEGLVDHDEPAFLALQESMAARWNPECQGWTKYNIQFTTRDKEMYADLQKLWDTIAASPGDFSITLQDNWDPTTDVQPCAPSDLEKKSSNQYPSINNMPAFFPSKRSSIGPDVVVSDGQSIVQAESIEPGKTYKIYAQNFPKGSTVQLQLMSADGDPEPIGQITNFDDDAVNAMEWTAPLDLDEDTNFYVKGAPLAFPNLFGNSQLLSRAAQSFGGGFGPKQ